MLKLITLLYGKPCEKDGSFKEKYFRFIYWFVVLFCTFGFVSAVISCFFNASILPSVILFVLVLPFFSRFVYSANLKLQGLRREK